MRTSKNRDRSQLALDLEPSEPRQFLPVENMKGLIEALADLLLEAIGERTTDATANQGGVCEPQDHA